MTETSANEQVEQIAAEPAAEAAPPPSGPGPYWGTGRRKAAVARVRLVRGKGTVLINDRPVEKYFSELQERSAVTEPLSRANALSHWDIHVNVNGGGHAGQAGAILLGVARALVKADPRSEPILRGAGFLTRDSRIVERKKYGRRKARRRFQFSKR